MAKAMKEYLQQDMACEGLLECFHGLKALDLEVFEVLADSDQALTVDEVAMAVERERSTAYRSIQRLLRAGILQKEQINYDQGGYYHVYRVADRSDMAQDMQRMLNDWYTQMGQLIQEFEDKYEGAGSIELPS